MESNRLNSIFSALADPTRRAIIERLAQSDASAGELAEPFGISKPAISKHLKVLEKAKLITRTKNAQWRRFHLEPESLDYVQTWLIKYRIFWEDQFEALSDYLKNDT